MIDRKASLAAALSAVLIAGPGIATEQPYAGQEAREIASLSASDIDDLLAGRGWGFALPAELNGYPGPTHVLDLAEDLRLDDAQRGRIEAIRAAMEAEAQRLGAAYVAAEAAIDAAFAEGRMTPGLLGDLTARAAGIEAGLRAVHLAAHLEVAPLLTRHQIATYNRLRGYGGGDGGHGSHGGH